MIAPDIFYENFREYIAATGLLSPGEKVLLAVSGGVDSMVMLSLFAAADYRIDVVHCNFQLRGEESDGDEALVRRRCGELGVEFHCRRFDTAGEVERTGESVQMAARRLRYEWFGELCREHGYTAVAIAHHADDAVETLFINLLRGTGLRGLTGIQNVGGGAQGDSTGAGVWGRVVRPLLFASRSEILAYATAHGVPFREDSSNRSTKYLRNKVRLELLPKFNEINPGFAAMMGDNIRRFTAAQLFIDHSIELIRRQVESTRDVLTVIDVSKIDPAFPLEFVLFELLSAYDFRGDVVEQLVSALNSGAATGRHFYSSGYVAYIDRGEVIVASITEDDLCPVMIDSDTTSVAFGNMELCLERMDIGSVGVLQQPDNVALLDADRVRFPLCARRWREGDRFVPLGMTGSKKVSDYLIDAKVSLAEKRRQLVLLDCCGNNAAADTDGSGGRVVWLVGRRIDGRLRITDTTKNILKITIFA